MAGSIKGRVLLVVDDEADWATLSAQLHRLGHRQAVVGRDRAIEKSIETHRPHVILVGIGPSDMARGLSIGERIRVTSTTPFVFVGDWLSSRDRLRAFQAGAEDVMRLPFQDDEFNARLGVVLRRHASSGAVLEFDDILIDEAAHLVVRNNMPVSVTSIEFSLLRAFMRHRGQVLSKTQLLADVWGYERYDVNVVEVHVSALRRKLEEFGPRVLHTVRGVGYVLRPETAVPLKVSAVPLKVSA